MIADVAAANPNTIVVINSGSPVVMPWLNSVAGVFENWYGGQETGAAMAALIFGTVDPSGKLPVTFPASAEPGPGADHRAVARHRRPASTYSEGVDIGYRWYQSQNITPGLPVRVRPVLHEVLLLQPGRRRLQRQRQATVTATVTNTGSVAGADVAQMYVGDPAASQDPPDQLKGFQRVTLNPGQSATVSLPADHPRPGLVVRRATTSGRPRPGAYSIKVGDASNNLPLTGSTSAWPTR